MTRSASLRQKKVQDEARLRAPPHPGPSATPHRPRSLSLSSYAQPTAASAAKASPLKQPSARPSSGPSVPFSFSATPRVSVPTSSAPSRTPADHPRPDATQLDSSLSTLNQALERLNAPPPSRPNTSIGFHTHSAPTDRDHDVRRPPSHERPATALAAPKATPARAAPQPRPSANAGHAPAPQKKALRQTTLVLLPARRAREQEGADGQDGGLAQKKRVDLALAGSLGKVRGSLGFGPPPAASAGASTPVAGAQVASAAPAQKRVFPAASSSTGRALFTGIGGSGVARPSATVAGASHPAAAARGTRPWRGIGGRIAQRVSKKSSLPVVQGSPVKGGVSGNSADPAERTDEPADDEDAGPERTTKDRIGAWLQNASADVLRDLAGDDLPESGAADARASPPPPTSSFPDAIASNDRGRALVEKARVREQELKRNASRRASLASQLLTQSLSAVPDTPPTIGGGGGLAEGMGKGKGRAASDSWSARGDGGEDSARGEDSVRGGEMPPPPVPPPRPRVHNTRLATGALATPPIVHAARASGSGGGADKGKGKGKESGNAESPAATAALVVLRGCTIFVDVRTEEGEDAGALFVDMLRGLGAKIATRLGSRCTHVVYKNGLMSTLTRYRLLKDPKPHAVGIAWVVECAEQRARVDESRFLVDLDLANVAGVNKRRRSMLPKFLLSSPGPDTKPSGVASPASSDSSVRTAAADGVPRLGNAHPAAGDKAGGASSPTAISTAMDEDGDSSMQSSGAGPGGTAARTDDEDSLPPLEKARRRRSMLPVR